MEASSQFDPEELDRLASIVANFFLAADVKKIPLKKAEISKLLPREYGRKASQVIEKASDKLQDIYGFKIVELQKKGTYILVNDIGEDLMKTELINSSDAEEAISNLRTMILALIFMNGGVVQEGVLRTFLGKFNINFDSSEKWPIYGNMSKLITQDFVRQCYLDITIVREVDPPFKEYRWGERSQIEVDKKKLLDFVCQMYGENVTPKMWLSQYKEAYQSATNNEVVNEEVE